MAQKICFDLQLGASEVSSPKREGLGSLFPPENSPSPISPPKVKSFPPPTPFASTSLMIKDKLETPTSESEVFEVENSIDEVLIVEYVED